MPFLVHLISFTPPRVGSQGQGQLHVERLLGVVQHAFARQVSIYQTLIAYVNGPSIYIKYCNLHQSFFVERGQIYR